MVFVSECRWSETVFQSAQRRRRLCGVLILFGCDSAPRRASQVFVLVLVFLGERRVLSQVFTFHSAVAEGGKIYFQAEN